MHADNLAYTPAPRWAISKSILKPSCSDSTKIEIVYYQCLAPLITIFVNYLMISYGFIWHFYAIVSILFADEFNTGKSAMNGYKPDIFHSYVIVNDWRVESVRSPIVAQHRNQICSADPSVWGGATSILCVVS